MDTIFHEKVTINATPNSDVSIALGHSEIKKKREVFNDLSWYELDLVFLRRRRERNGPSL